MKSSNKSIIDASNYSKKTIKKPSAWLSKAMDEERYVEPHMIEWKMKLMLSKLVPNKAEVIDTLEKYGVWYNEMFAILKHPVESNYYIIIG